MQSYVANGTVRGKFITGKAKDGTSFASFMVRSYQPNGKRRYFYLPCKMWGNDLVGKAEKIAKENNEVMVKGTLRDHYSPKTGTYKLFVDVTEISLIVKGLAYNKNGEGTSFDPTIVEDEEVVGVEE